MTENQKYLKEAQVCTKTFEDKLEPEQLDQAYLALENVLLQEEDNPQTRNQLRVDLLYLWLHLIQLLDRYLDPNFDPNDVPARAIQPPPTSKGIVYPPGADPALIDNLQARTQYEQAIVANNAKTIHYRLQIHLRRLDERITSCTEKFIKDFYTSALVDQKELRNAIDEMIKEPRRKASLLKVMTSLS